MKFKIGDRVRLTKDQLGDTESNPIWNGKHGKTKGTVVDIHYNLVLLPFVIVKWDGGKKNAYLDVDISFITELPEELFEI